MIDQETINSTADVEPAAPLVDEQGPIPTFPPRTVDPALGAVPELSEEERAARAEAFARAMKVIASITDESDERVDWAEAMRDLDSFRPHRPLFEGMY